MSIYCLLSEEEVNEDGEGVVLDVWVAEALA